MLVANGLVTGRTSAATSEQREERELHRATGDCRTGPAGRALQPTPGLLAPPTRPTPAQPTTALLPARSEYRW